MVDEHHAQGLCTGPQVQAHGTLLEVLLGIPLDVGLAIAGATQATGQAVGNVVRQRPAAMFPSAGVATGNRMRRVAGRGGHTGGLRGLLGIEHVVVQGLYLRLVLGTDGHDNEAVHVGDSRGGRQRHGCARVVGGVMNLAHAPWGVAEHTGDRSHGVGADAHEVGAGDTHAAQGLERPVGELVGGGGRSGGSSWHSGGGSWRDGNVADCQLDDLAGRGPGLDQIRRRGAIGKDHHQR